MFELICIVAIAYVAIDLGASAYVIYKRGGIRAALTDIKDNLDRQMSKDAKRLKDEPPTFTVEGCDQTFHRETHARVVAGRMQLRLQRSIRIYRNGKLIRHKRY